MSKVLVATVKPFASQAIEKMREVFSTAGHEMVLLEKYGSKEELLTAVKDADALIVDTRGRNRVEF